MPRPYVTLSEHPCDIVQLACTKCERRGQYRKGTLIERYCPDKNMVDLARAGRRPPGLRPAKTVDACGVYYPDRIGNDGRAGRSEFRREMQLRAPVPAANQIRT